MRLNNEDNLGRIYLLYIVTLLTATVFWRTNDNAARILKHTDTSTTSSALEHKVGADEPGTIWIVNQPKCGTGTLQMSIAKAFHCRLVKKWSKNFFDCPGGKKVFRDHDLRTIEKVKKMVDEDMDRSGTKPDRCVVITAVRNPLLSIPSRFFEDNSERFCDGTQSKEEIIKEYEKFLLGPLPSNRVRTTAQMLRAFGAKNISEAMELLSEEGYTFLNQPEENGPWAGCELLFLQIDYDESNSNIDKGLDHAVEGVKMIQNPGLVARCPNAEENYRAVQKYRIPDEQIDMFSMTNPDFRDVLTYYRNRQNNTQRRLNR